MSVNKKWNVETYRFPYESEEHWKLKREFMLAHKSKIPEEQLVCLAQVYVNVKLLGCKYPAETMAKIAALGVNLGKEYKEKQKTRLQRTFVKASDAAEAKIMRAPKRKINDTNQEDRNTKKVPLSQRPVAFVKSSDNQMKNQKTKIENADTQETSPPKQRKLAQNEAKTLVARHETDQQHRNTNKLPLSQRPLAFVKSSEVLHLGKTLPETPEVEENEAEVEENETEEVEEEEAETEEVEVEEAETEATSEPDPRQNDQPRNNINLSVNKYKLAVQNNSKFANAAAQAKGLLPGRGIGQSSVRQGRGALRPGPHLQGPVGGPPAFNKTNNFAPSNGMQPSPAATPPAVRQMNNFAPSYGMQQRQAQRPVMKFKINERDPLAKFVILMHEYRDSNSVVNTIYQSATFSHMNVEFKCTDQGPNVECAVLIQGTQVGKAKDTSKKGAKESASLKALEELQRRCYTLRILKQHSSEEEVSVTDVDGRVSKVNEGGSSIDRPVEDTSVGSKLLKMMGWSGGGLGKEESGITEPIRPATVFGREGLGHEEQGVTQKFRSYIRTLLSDFAKGSSLKDLAFSPEFSREQRAEIHANARKFKLKSKSFGGGENRFLVLSRKFSALELIEKIMQEGGSSKYEVLPPRR
ncbi:uncharacterized protein LOC122252786 [Penaeus japonicus]|uniref:uncharacterized protein LOC122252786 n=1 Tax=Penaeus japonicus TaxID=27405 RepID=UPI001C7172DE|nr:uncharacterized protein LOC122252786 [Penaeus japonicus]XP_042871382.1 uncharacterized protein LOC122252786 [Penaeus japonicus]